MVAERLFIDLSGQSLTRCKMRANKLRDSDTHFESETGGSGAGQLQDKERPDAFGAQLSEDV